MKTVYMVTNNPMKVIMAEEVLANPNLKVELLKEDTPEIQSMDVAEIAKFSAKWAADKYQKPVVKMDNSFWIEALKGFPGPFAAYADKTISRDGIIKLMAGVENRKAKFIMAVAYCEPGKEPIVETAELHGLVSDHLEGTFGWFTDRFFIADGYDHTMGCYPDEVRRTIWPNHCWTKMAERILNEF